MATTLMHTILIVGGTSGIGEAFARRFHSTGKKVIITGRRKDRLASLQNELPGLETYALDVSQLDTLESHVDRLFARYPSLDTVFFIAGMQVASDIKDAASTTDAKVVREITTNVTAPMIFARHCIPMLLAKKEQRTTLVITSSGLGFMPIGTLFPVYCSTKAAIHSYCVGLRQALKGTNVSVLELVPPYVSTELDVGHREQVKMTPMPLQEFTDEIFKTLDGTKIEELKEVSAGTAVPRVEAWRSSIGKMLENGLGG